MKLKKLFLEIFETIALIVLIVLPIRHFIFEPFIIKGESMLPNFHSGDYLISEKFSLFFKNPERFDVIIFKSPVHDDYYIKRIIGLPGETVEIKEGKIIIYNSQNPNGFVLQESYQTIPLSYNENFKITLGKDEYFVLGDNRQASFDSRKWGALKRENIKGKVLIRIWPLNFNTYAK